MQRALFPTKKIEMRGKSQNKIQKKREKTKENQTMKPTHEQTLHANPAPVSPPPAPATQILNLLISKPWNSLFFFFFAFFKKN
jgi:hypothetical protein